MKFHFFEIRPVNILLKSLANLFFTVLFLHVKHFEASALLRVVKGILDTGPNVSHFLLLESKISDLPAH